MGQIIDRVPTNCQVEPPYPGLDTVVFALRDPSLTAHGVTLRCAIEHPHSTADCGEWSDARVEKCWICWSNEDRNVRAVAFCTELKRPVCQKHADGCKQDGHEALPLEEE